MFKVRELKVERISNYVILIMFYHIHDLSGKCLLYQNRVDVCNQGWSMSIMTIEGRIILVDVIPRPLMVNHVGTLWRPINTKH